MKNLSQKLYKIFILCMVVTIPLFASSCAASRNDYSSNEEIAKAAEIMYEEYLQSISDRSNELASGKITIGDASIKVYATTIGQPDENGYPLYIALRGGGNPDKKLSDEQFENMKNYYKGAVEYGVYVVPHTIINGWDENYRPETFLFYDRIIEDAIAFYNVDPNRVYLTGFSSGGDGVYSIAPRISERFAAVNMSAGYPHMLLLDNLYNLPMCIQMGEYDTAYDRHLIAAKYDGWLDEYAQKYGGGFTHETFIHKNGDHNNWSDCDDRKQLVYTGDEVAKWLNDPGSAQATVAQTSAIRWFNQYTRNPLPERIVWNTAGYASLRDSHMFYWLDRDGLLTNATIIASYNTENNSVTIEQCDAEKGTLKIFLNPQMLDVFSDVTVNFKDTSVVVRPIVSRQIMQNTITARGDKNYIFTSEIDIVFDKNTELLDIKAVEETTFSYDVSQPENLIYWDSEGLFFVNEGLFNLTYDELVEKLATDITVPATQPDGVVFSTADFGMYKVIFTFKNDRCVSIQSEHQGKSSKLEKHVTACFGESYNAFVTGGISRYFLDSRYENYQYYIIQKYVSYYAE